MTPSFTDSNGFEWKISIDPWLLTKVKDETDILLTKWADDNFSLAMKLRTEPQVLCAVLFSLCDEQAKDNGAAAKAEAAGTSLAREFARGLGGDTLMSAVEALESALTFFCMSQGERKARQALLRKAKELESILGENLVTKMESVDAHQLAKNCIGSVLSSPESQESIHSPEGSHSAN